MSCEPPCVASDTFGAVVPRIVDLDTELNNPLRDRPVSILDDDELKAIVVADPTTTSGLDCYNFILLGLSWRAQFYGGRLDCVSAGGWKEAVDCALVGRGGNASDVNSGELSVTGG
ncbi:unnamed protein product [Pieris macdunnoughi]|uniref:Uncharacterized protein n=1 Tax=Pieris macdunnoughi TaxID=345717 RepID=A0A821RR37_9NEOP|nr:unnamed protein product [Pieris macdunnoughi]